MLLYRQRLKKWSQELRKNSTPQESKLWYNFLRRHPCSFSRQKPVSIYIVDFICRSKRLIIEIDGQQHYTVDGLRYDNIRTDVLKGLGLRVLRFTNTEINNHFSDVCAAIQNDLDTH